MGRSLAIYTNVRIYSLLKWTPSNSSKNKTVKKKAAPGTILQEIQATVDRIIIINQGEIVANAHGIREIYNENRKHSIRRS